MQHFQVSHHNNDFVVIGTTNRSQAATMVLAPGDSEGGPDNRHDNTDQWVYVIAGTGMAVVNGKQVELNPGTLLLIEAGKITSSSIPASSRWKCWIFTRRRSISRHCSYSIGEDGKPTLSP